MDLASQLRALDVTITDGDLVARTPIDGNQEKQRDADTCSSVPSRSISDRFTSIVTPGHLRTVTSIASLSIRRIRKSCHLGVGVCGYPLELPP
jgi:hypothetical protein